MSFGPRKKTDKKLAQQSATGNIVSCGAKTTDFGYLLQLAEFQRFANLLIFPPFGVVAGAR